MYSIKVGIKGTRKKRVSHYTSYTVMSILCSRRKNNCQMMIGSIQLIGLCKYSILKPLFMHNHCQSSSIDEDVVILGG